MGCRRTDIAASNSSKRKWKMQNQAEAVDLISFFEGDQRCLMRTCSGRV